MADGLGGVRAGADGCVWSVRTVSKGLDSKKLLRLKGSSYLS